MCNESRDQTAKRFGSRQNTTESRRPKLTITFTAPACPADLDGSGTVDVADLVQLLGAWGPCAGCLEDVDGSGAVDVADLVVLLAAWGPCV
jgi:hypothetical protein